MCLITFAWQPATQVPLQLVANRDEQHARPTAPLDFWVDQPQILAGRDLRAGGTWLGLNRWGHFAALTNFREPGVAASGRSRGHLVADYLQEQRDPLAHARQLQAEIGSYAGFNLLLGNREQLVYLSNRSADTPRVLEAGVYGLSNALLNSPWPKLKLVREGLSAALREGKLGVEVAMQLMAYRQPFADHLLPDTGVARAVERMLSPPFILTPVYGTRCTNWLALHRQRAELIERSFDPAGAVTRQVEKAIDLTASAA